MILALVLNGSYECLAREISREFNHISAESLQTKLAEITADSSRIVNLMRSHWALQPRRRTAHLLRAVFPERQKTPYQYTEDLTAKAAAGKIDPVLGRDSEIRQLIDILTRRRQNNPILTGEAGVGKTAVVEGFAPASHR